MSEWGVWTVGKWTGWVVVRLRTSMVWWSLAWGCCSLLPVVRREGSERWGRERAVRCEMWLAPLSRARSFLSFAAVTLQHAQVSGPLPRSLRRPVHPRNTPTHRSHLDLLKHLLADLSACCITTTGTPFEGIGYRASRESLVAAPEGGANPPRNNNRQQTRTALFPFLFLLLRWGARHTHTTHGNPPSTRHRLTRCAPSHLEGG